MARSSRACSTRSMAVSAASTLRRYGADRRTHPRFAGISLETLGASGTMLEGGKETIVASTVSISIATDARRSG